MWTSFNLQQSYLLRQLEAPTSIARPSAHSIYCSKFDLNILAGKKKRRERIHSCSRSFQLPLNLCLPTRSKTNQQQCSRQRTRDNRDRSNTRAEERQSRPEVPPPLHQSREHDCQRQLSRTPGSELARFQQLGRDRFVRAACMHALPPPASLSLPHQPPSHRTRLPACLRRRGAEADPTVGYQQPTPARTHNSLANHARGRNLPWPAGPIVSIVRSVLFSAPDPARVVRERDGTPRDRGRCGRVNLGA